MPCHHPLQAVFLPRADGKKDVYFSNSNAKRFVAGFKPVFDTNSICLPCGQCMGCRLERSRQWAVRCLHESKLYDDNCFVTLTYDDDHIESCGPNRSLVRDHFQSFMKRLRSKFSDSKIRVFYCGEYGEACRTCSLGRRDCICDFFDKGIGRPHFHACLFNFDFVDKKFWKRSCDERLYVSSDLSSLWPFGFHSVGSLTFESAGYVARYCTKKITGPMAEAHYGGRVPEFNGMSLKPGIGRGFIDKFGKTDVFPFDECVVRGNACKPPRYYDKVLESIDANAFDMLRKRRVEKAKLKEDDNTNSRLLVKEKCLEARFTKLVRLLERG